MDCSLQPSTSPCDQINTNILIIGNGPAGLSLSAFLSGWVPFYDPSRPHPDPLIHQKLLERMDESLLDQGLTWLSEIPEMYTSDLRPISLLYDTLVRPNADRGHLRRSCIRWEHDPCRTIPHLIVGESPPGGSWNEYDDKMLALSVASYLDLPAYSFADWLGKDPHFLRPTAALVCKYMLAYTKAIGIRKNILRSMKITQVTKCGSKSTGTEFWQVRGVSDSGNTVMLTCHKLVLACGMNHFRMLNVDGEIDVKNIVYDVVNLRRMISSFPRDQKIRVVVVGDGISAADAVLHCLNRRIPVVQISRRTEKQLRYVRLSRLSSSLYAEYAHVYRLMIGRATDRLYSLVTNASLASLSHGIITFNVGSIMKMESFDVLCIAIGRKSDLSMMDDVYKFEDYECISDRSLFCVGSFAGDKLVRHIIGGCLYVARLLVSATT